MAPEIHRYFRHSMDNEDDEGYSKGVDCWSLGVTVAELLLGRNWFRDASPDLFFDPAYPPDVYVEMFKALQKLPQVSSEAVNFIKG